MAVGDEKVSTLLAQVDVLGCKALALRGVIFVERGAWAGVGCCQCSQCSQCSHSRMRTSENIDGCASVEEGCASVEEGCASVEDGCASVEL